MSAEEFRRLKEKGKEHLGQGNSDKAIEYYTRALNEASKLLETGDYLPEFSPQEVRVTCANLTDHDSKSCKHCGKYLEVAVCYSNRSLACCNIKKYERALLDSEEAIRLAPQWPKGYFRKAEALLGMEQYEIAKLFYDQVICLEPEGSSSIDLLKMKILNADLLEEARATGLYFRPLIPGEHICTKTWNPLSKLVFEFAKKMRNVVYAIGDVDSKECVVVDPCWDVDGILKEVCEVDGMKIVGILATHNHFDHVGGRPPAPFDSYGVNVGGVAKLLEKIPDISVRIHRADAELLISEGFVPRDRITLIESGDRMKIGRHDVEFIHTPGHTPGSQCIRFGPGMRRVLTGDTLFCGSCGRVDFPGGDVHELYKSLFEQISKWPEEMSIFPAHSYGGKLLTSLWYERIHGILRFKRKEEFAARLGVRIDPNSRAANQKNNCK